MLPVARGARASARLPRTALAEDEREIVTGCKPKVIRRAHNFGLATCNPGVEPLNL
jgi:hypothetical protein